MAKYTGVTQNKDGSWSYRIKKKVDGKVIDTKIKKDDSGMPFLTARACYEAKIRHEAQICILRRPVAAGAVASGH